MGREGRGRHDKRSDLGGTGDDMGGRGVDVDRSRVGTGGNREESGRTVVGDGCAKNTSYLHGAMVPLVFLLFVSFVFLI